jgi:hypothetical protein
MEEADLGASGLVRAEGAARTKKRPRRGGDPSFTQRAQKIPGAPGQVVPPGPPKVSRRDGTPSNWSRRDGTLAFHIRGVDPPMRVPPVSGDPVCPSGPIDLGRDGTNLVGRLCLPPAPGAGRDTMFHRENPGKKRDGIDSRQRDGTRRIKEPRTQSVGAFHSSANSGLGTGHDVSPRKARQIRPGHIGTGLIGTGGGRGAPLVGSPGEARLKTGGFRKAERPRHPVARDGTRCSTETNSQKSGRD